MGRHTAPTSDISLPCIPERLLVFSEQNENLDILEEDHIVMSDVKAMYVNINTDHAIEIIRL